MPPPRAALAAPRTELNQPLAQTLQALCDTDLRMPAERPAIASVSDTYQGWSPGRQSSKRDGRRPALHVLDLVQQFVQADRVLRYRRRD